VARAGNSAVSNAVKGLEPRAPELEIPRPLSAGLSERGSVELWAARERLQPLPYPTPTGRPPLTRSGIVGGVEKAKGTTPGPGFRVYKIKVNKVNKDRLKVLYNDIIHKRNGNIPKGLLYYAEEWVEMYDNAKRMREEAGKRTPPKAPPLHLLVRFVMPDGERRGKTAASAVIDLRRGELRIPSYGIVEKRARTSAPPTNHTRSPRGKPLGGEYSRGTSARGRRGGESEAAPSGLPAGAVDEPMTLWSAEAATQRRQ